MPCEFEVEKLMSKLSSGATVSLTFRKFYCLLPAHSFDISQNKFLEIEILKVEVLIKHLFNHKVNKFHLRLVPHLHLGFSNNIPGRGGEGITNFARVREIVLWVD